GGADPPLKPEGSEFGGLVRLDSAGIAPQQVRPGEVLRLYLRWSALKEPGRKYVAFVHLVDKEGRGCTGRDGEPVDGLRPTESWRTGEVIDDRRGLMVGPGTPPGPYYLAVGLYDREDWTRRLLLEDARGDKVLLGPLEVLPAPGSTPQDTSVASAPEIGLELLGFDVDPRWEAQVIKNVDGPVEVWTPAATRPGATVPVTLRWRAGRPLGDAYRLRLEVVDGDGKGWGLAPEAPIGGQCPSFRWAPGEVVSETREVSIQPDAPRGQYRLRAIVYPQEGDVPVAGPLVFGTLSVAGK
ncbi:MAG TPA: hypothetical protein VJO15_09520, partial [Dehalococcoidia bacterium]|nr:hypothetical protein [Dehalococcoidia bacterium]